MGRKDKTRSVPFYVAIISTLRKHACIFCPVFDETGTEIYKN